MTVRIGYCWSRFDGYLGNVRWIASPPGLSWGDAKELSEEVTMTGDQSKRWRLLAVMVLVFGVSACATGTTTVLERATERQAVKTLRIVAAENTVDVPPDVTAHFQSRLREYLITDGKYGAGDDLTLRYRFIQVDEGSRSLRWIIGFGAGKGELTVEVVYLDASGNEVSKINVGGELSVGFFGGDFDEAVSNAAREAAEYTIANFPANI